MKKKNLLLVLLLLVVNIRAHALCNQQLTGPISLCTLSAHFTITNFVSTNSYTATVAPPNLFSGAINISGNNVHINWLPNASVILGSANHATITLHITGRDRKSTRLNSSHGGISRMPSSA